MPVCSLSENSLVYVDIRTYLQKARLHLSLTDYILWLAAPLFQVGVAVALLRRGLHKE